MARSQRIVRLDRRRLGNFQRAERCADARAGLLASALAEVVEGGKVLDLRLPDLLFSEHEVSYHTKAYI